METKLRTVIGWLYTEEAKYAVLHRVGNRAFIATPLPSGGDINDIFPTPSILTPEGDYGIVTLQQGFAIEIVAPGQ